MTPHPAAEIMKELLQHLDDIINDDDIFIEYTDLKTNQQRVYSNMHDDNTIELHDIVCTNHYIFHKLWYGYYTIHEGNRIWIEEY
jgi:hypothetical protein